MSLTELFGGRREETTPEIIVDAKGTTRNVNTGVEAPPVTPPPTLDLPGITPGLQEANITINPQGEVKNVFTGEVQPSPQPVPNLNLPSEAPVIPVEPSQTNVDPKYQPLVEGKTDSPYHEVVKQVPTVTVQDPSGTQYFPQDAHLDVETGTFEGKEGAKPAPSNVDLIVGIKENEKEQKSKRRRQAKKEGGPKKVQEQKPDIIKKDEFDLNKSLQESNLSFRPAVKIAKGEEGKERMMITLTETGSHQVGFEELKEAFGTKRVREDGKIVITYLGGKTDNNGEPTYSQDIVLDSEQVAVLEPFVEVIDKNREDIAADLRGENSQPFTDLMDTKEAQRYKNSYIASEGTVKQGEDQAEENEDEAAEEEEGAVERTEIDELRDQITRLEAQIAQLTLLVQQATEGPVPEETPAAPTPQPELPRPAAANANAGQLNDEELRALRGELTPEQQSTQLGEQIEELEALRQERELTDAEKSSLLDLRYRKDNLDRDLSDQEKESQESRTRKETWVRRVATVAGFATALATPAISIPAVIAITLGGPLIARYGIKKIEGRVRAKSTQIKYQSRRGKSLEELKDMDKRQKRAEWWANRLGEAAAVVTGGAFGYGLGNLFEQVVLGGDAIGPKGMEKAVPDRIADTTGIDKTGLNQPIDQTGLNQAGIENLDLAGASETPSWLGEGTFNASDLGWDYNRYGWLGDQIHTGATGGQQGLLQGEFFSKLGDLVPQENLIGQTNGDIVNSFLVRAYNGMNPSMAAEKAAEVLLGQ